MSVVSNAKRASEGKCDESDGNAETGSWPIWRNEPSVYIGRGQNIRQVVGEGPARGAVAEGPDGNSPFSGFVAEPGMLAAGCPPDRDEGDEM